MQILARALNIGLGTEVCHIDDKSVALPMTTRVAEPLADIRRQMRACVHDDVALPALPLTYVVEHRDAAWRLHDASEAPAIGGAELGQPPGQPPAGQRAV